MESPAWERGQEKIIDKLPARKSHVTDGAGAGQLKKVTHQDGAYTSYGYDLHGRVTEQTGSADYPVRYTYQATAGWMTEMKTSSRVNNGLHQCGT